MGCLSGLLWILIASIRNLDAESSIKYSDNWNVDLIRDKRCAEETKTDVRKELKVYNINSMSEGC